MKKKEKLFILLFCNYIKTAGLYPGAPRTFRRPMETVDLIFRFYINSMLL
jgi:hypothetical protein